MSQEVQAVEHAGGAQQQAAGTRVQGNGGSWAPGGAGAPLGSVVQNQIREIQTEPNEVFCFKSSGTFFINDQASHNTWMNVPWEFPRLWIKGRELWLRTIKYKYWRTKGVRITLKSPYQRYAYQIGTNNLSAQDMGARMLIWQDKHSQYGNPFNPGWSRTNFNEFVQAFPSGGFSNSTSAAWYLPVKLDLDKQAVTGKKISQAITDFGPNTEMIMCGVGTETTRTYIPSNGQWRSTDELANSIERECTSTVNYNDPVAITLQDVPIGKPVHVFRADNYGCVKVSWLNAARIGNSYKHTYISNVVPEAGKIVNGEVDTNNSYNYDGFNFVTAGGYCVAGKDQEGALYGNPVDEEHPQGMLWVSYRNLLGPDLTSIQAQRVQVDVHYEWVVEFSGCELQNENPSQMTNIEQQSVNPYSLKAKPRSFIDPRTFAVPFYPTQCRGGDLTATDKVVNTTSPGLDQLITPTRLARYWQVNDDPT